MTFKIGSLSIALNDAVLSGTRQPPVGAIETEGIPARFRCRISLQVLGRNEEKCRDFLHSPKISNAGARRRTKRGNVETFADKVIVAGLIDQHLHPFLSALTMTSEIISIEEWIIPGRTFPAARDHADYLARLGAAEAAMVDAEEPLISWGFHHYFHGKLTRQDLDSIRSSRPIIVWHRSTHEFILNTPALDSSGVTEALIAAAPVAVRAQIDFSAGHFWERGAFEFVLPRIRGVLAAPARFRAGLEPERANEMVRLGDVVRAGVSLSLHSDMPMAPGRPLFLMWAAVNRQTPSGRVAGPEQRVSVEVALKAVTIDAAYSLQLEGEIGSITPGKRANFTILEADPFAVEPIMIKDIGVWGTVLEGRVQPVR